jgi:hypothetical protein
MLGRSSRVIGGLHWLSRFHRHQRVQRMGEDEKSSLSRQSSDRAHLANTGMVEGTRDQAQCVISRSSWITRYRVLVID